MAINKSIPIIKAIKSYGVVALGLSKLVYFSLLL